MIIYLAARYSRGWELQNYRDFLEQKGHAVSSRWLNKTHELGAGLSKQAADEERARFAVEDFHDVMIADCVMSFTEEPRTTKTRGGRHVEFGAALATKKRCIVIGWRENVFHHMPQVEFYKTFDEAIQHL